MKIKFILSDLDGVIRQYPLERNSRIEKKYNLPEGSLLQIAFEKEDLEKAICGMISDEDWRQSIADRLITISNIETARMAIQEWSNFSGVVDHEYLEYVKAKFVNIPLAVLTNGTTRLKSDLAKLDIDRHFFKIFNSADIGFFKPDRKVFEHVLGHLNCKADEILFIDDSASHIEGAKSLGFSTHHYKSLEDFKLALEG